jgi:hypothetical protein
LLADLNCVGGAFRAAAGHPQPQQRREDGYRNGEQQEGGVGPEAGGSVRLSPANAYPMTMPAGRVGLQPAPRNYPGQYYATGCVWPVQHFNEF